LSIRITFLIALLAISRFAPAQAPLLTIGFMTYFDAKDDANVPLGAPLFYIDFRGLSLGINQRNFSEIYKLPSGTGC
jgi:hypothetical protein